MPLLPPLPVFRKHPHPRGEDRETLELMVEALARRHLVPIHTFAPEEYAGFGAQVLRCDDGERVAL